MRGPIPDPVGRAAIYRSAPVVVFPFFHDRTARAMLDCLAAGGCPVYRRPDSPVETLHPQLAEVLAVVPSAPSLDKLTELAKRLATDARARQTETAGARSMVLERHTLAHRLRAIRDRMAQRRHSTVGD